MGFSRTFPMRTWAITLLACLLLLAKPGQAEIRAAKRATARDNMAQGDKAMDQGDYAQALVRYTAAQSIIAVPTTHLAVGLAQWKLGGLVEAQDALLRVLRYPQQTGEPQVFRQARKRAADLLRKLERQIPRLRFRMAAGLSGSLRVDDQLLGTVRTGSRYRINPGEHRLEIRSSGYEPFRAAVRLLPSSEQTVYVQQDRLPKSYRPPTAAWVAGSMALIGGLVGGVTGAIALADSRSLHEACNTGACDSSLLKRYKRANTLARISNIGFIVGGSGLTVGLGVLLTDRFLQPTQSKADGMAAKLRFHF
jgi:hypothetical protein